jgi:adenylate kinase
MKLKNILFSLFSLLFPICAFGNLIHQTMDRPLIFIMLGAPGAGKGTHAVRLSDQFGLPQISTGDLFRENLRNNTPIGQQAKSYMDQGQLVPDEIVLGMLFERISREDCARGYILDGFPRTIPQAEALSVRLDQSNGQVIAISLEVPDEIIIERLTGRLVCESCSAPYHRVSMPPQTPGICDRCGSKLIQRKDDTQQVVLERLRVFHEQTEPVKGYFQKKGNLVLIDGSVSKEKTIAQIDEYLAKMLIK